MDDLGLPSIYHGPHQRPLVWHEETIGDLRAAVEAFLSVAENWTDRDFELVKAYLVYHIHAPSWLEQNPGGPLHPDLAGEVRSLRKASREIGTVTHAWAYLADCLALGIDPL